ncbi:transport-energizing ATPase, TRC40/GET3/ArsA family [Gottschalkia purinilytica]|uniref:Transport-energizing ATPase, TRC40/GET3/ArsA family n=1 Tax=Gottschalkia purinilytica TaxID=1503 RepID=A0A0L0W718_GOTPU|nr:TRC40/GET3/ArsA family transport-energizing ATPase [Gottschalkia purinilytica]KNF07309.1 transport-energizing ATPase, TRC40/GET3/ArsA family [Gottschalkia purinilytica]
MDTKFIFFSGKGGVGKTSMACTTAVYHASKGKKTLIVTTDPAANLSDVFEQEIGHRVTQIDNVKNLYAMEIDPDKATDEYKERSIAPMRDFFDDEMIQIVDEQLSGPCTVEMASFDKFIDFMEDDSYDIIVFDTAPTGHTIRLLELPADWSKHIESSSQGSGQTCMGPVSLIQDNKKKYDDAVEKLRNKEKTEFIFVMQGEGTSLEETIRSSKELEEIGIKTSKIIVNGLIPKEESSNVFFKERYDMQQKYLKKTMDIFKDIDIQPIQLLNNEVKGLNMLIKLSEQLFNDCIDISVMKNKEAEDSLSEDILKKENIEEKPFEDSLIYPKKGKRKNIFFSGKGGVGKTSMACITAVKTASRGYKTLLMTTDPAAHIGNVLEKPVNDEITKIDEINNLYAVKIDQKKVTEEYKESVLSDAREKFDENTIKIMAEELDSPCTEEMASFQKFIEYASRNDFEVIVFDTAPTGHTLRLLELPMDWSKQLQFKAGESTELSEEDKKQKERFDEVIEMMKDKESTTFAFVMYPEKTPIIEAYRASKELETLDINTQLVIANLIIPENQAQTSFFKNRRNMQLKYIDEIKTIFRDVALVKVPMFDREIKGIDMINDIADCIFK